MSKKKVTAELLKKLNEYNDSLLDEDYESKQQRKIRKQKQREKIESDEDETLTQANKTNIRQKKKERKKRKREKLLTTDSLNTLVHKDKSDSKKSLKGEKKTLYDIKTELGLDEFKRKNEIQNIELSKSENSTKPGPEVVVYENPSKRKRKNNDVKTKFKSSNDDDFDMKKARFEVRKFGIKGLDTDKKDEAMTALLVQLGAKPPKKKYFNYKEFIDIRKQEMEDAKKKKEIDRNLGFKVKPNRGKRREKDRNEVGRYLDGQVGRYKHGVQFIERKELIGFDKKRRK